MCSLVSHKTFIPLFTDLAPSLCWCMGLFLLWSRTWLFPLWNFRKVCQSISPADKVLLNGSTNIWWTNHSSQLCIVSNPALPCVRNLVILKSPIKISDCRKYQMSRQNPVIVTCLKNYTQGGVVWLQLKSLGFSAIFLLISGQLPEEKCFIVLTFHKISQRYFWAKHVDHSSQLIFGKDLSPGKKQKLFVFFLLIHI